MEPHAFDIFFKTTQISSEQFDPLVQFDALENVDLSIPFVCEVEVELIT